MEKFFFVFFFLCAVIEQLAWADILKLLGNQKAMFLKSPGLPEVG